MATATGVVWSSNVNSLILAGYPLGAEQIIRAGDACPSRKLKSNM